MPNVYFYIPFGAFTQEVRYWLDTLFTVVFLNVMALFCTYKSLLIWF